MNNTISKTIGIDKEIQSIQTTLYESLVSQWINDLDGHGRVYKNNDIEGRVFPQWYVGDREYKDVYYNDAFSGLFMFVDSDNHSTIDEVVYSSEVKVIFMLDLSRIFPLETVRADMLAQNDVIEILRNNAFNRYKITGITKGLKNVFQGFNIDKIKFTDMQPFHCFSVNLDLTYYLTDKC